MMLQGKTALVMGGSSGIGLATARMVRENGARVAIMGSSQDRLDRAAAELGDVLAIRRNVASLLARMRGVLDQSEADFRAYAERVGAQGEEARAPVATIFKDWAADPVTATAADRATAGHMVPRDAPWVLGPWRQRLALAGSETCPSEPGYLACAVVAARRAVDDGLTKLSQGTDHG